MMMWFTVFPGKMQAFFHRNYRTLPPISLMPGGICQPDRDLIFRQPQYFNKMYMKQLRLPFMFYNFKYLLIVKPGHMYLC